MRNEAFKKKFAGELPTLIHRRLVPRDGAGRREIATAERRLRIELPLSLKTYYEVAGNLEINTQHNRLYAPRNLTVEGSKLVFMEENQAVVFWGMDLKKLDQADPEVFQAANDDDLVWYSEELNFSDWILKMWKWQLGIDQKS